jgi:DNA polymerase III subunit epsilon
LHGALLDAGLLAEVYIRLTRGQDALVIDASSQASDAKRANAVPAVDLSTLALAVLEPSADDLQAHAAWLAVLAKKSAHGAVWASAQA